MADDVSLQASGQKVADRAARAVEHQPGTDQGNGNPLIGTLPDANAPAWNRTASPTMRTAKSDDPVSHGRLFLLGWVEVAGGSPAYRHVGDVQDVEE